MIRMDRKYLKTTFSPSMSLIIYTSSLLFWGIACQPKSSSDQTQESQSASSKASSQSTSKDPTFPSSQKKAKPKVPVEGIKVSKRSISATLSSIAVVEAKEKASIRALTSGILTSLKVDEGSRVKKKQVLAKITRPGARSLINKAYVAYQKAREDEKQIKKLIKSGLAPKEEGRQARFNTQQSRLELNRLQQEASNETIKSPLKGVVVQKSVYQGESINAGQVLFEIVDLREVRIPVFIPETWSAQLKTGLPVILKDRKGKTISDDAKLSYVSPIVDPQSGTIKAFVSPPKKQILRPGLYLQTEIILDTIQDALVIPKSAVLYKENQAYVMVAREGVASQVYVQTGYQQGQLIQIKSPLKEGETVISFGQRGLENNTPIDVNLTSF